MTVARSRSTVPTRLFASASASRVPSEDKPLHFYFFERVEKETQRVVATPQKMLRPYAAENNELSIATTAKASRDHVHAFLQRGVFAYRRVHQDSGRGQGGGT